MNFNYRTISAKLGRQTRSVSVVFRRDSINREMIFELESIFGWLSRHIEVNAIVLSSSSEEFCRGLDKNELAGMDEAALKKHLLRLQKMIHALLHLPQTVICDLGGGCAGVGVELSTACDLRLARRDARLKADFLCQGLSPSCGGVELLQAIVGEAHARNWLLSSHPVETAKLLQAGFLHQVYDSDAASLKASLLEQINTQSPVARIQAKRALLEGLLPEIERAGRDGPRFSFACLQSGDWKKAINGGDYSGVVEMANQITNRERYTPRSRGETDPAESP